MRFALGLPLLLIGCAAGGRPLEQEPPADSPKPPSDGPVSPDPVPDAMPPDSTVLPPDASATPDTQTLPDACVAAVTEKLANPALDLAPIGTGWTQVLIQNLDGGPYPIITADGLAPISAPNKAWMGGAAGFDANPAVATVTDQLFQDITFPADATTFVVTGMFAVGGIEDTDQVFDTFTLDVIETNGTQIENVLVLSNMTPAAAFAPFSKALTSNLAGRTVRLRATSTNDVLNHTNFFLDSLSFKGTFCP